MSNNVIKSLYLRSSSPPQLWCKFISNDTSWDFLVKRARQTGDMVEIIGYVPDQGRDVSIVFSAEEFEPYKDHVHVWHRKP